MNDIKCTCRTPLDENGNMLCIEVYCSIHKPAPTYLCSDTITILSEDDHLCTECKKPVEGKPQPQEPDEYGHVFNILVMTYDKKCRKCNTITKS